ncbi:hypothetical protein VP01_152g1 [Puccinia sorghi]|uniref:HAT C-terminal dimerisation domain-containing protein n=1 Tax=Puccinia sorghi TaxID=27349 RepID=A0A0L6VIR3_9BASI|nr:hypothetical protein VP01_152g1 [Puccinia sorghi]
MGAGNCNIGPFKDISCPIVFGQRYLASSASSCAAEKTFSSAANVCPSGCGILKPWKIDRCVSSHMWLKQGIKITGRLEKAQRTVNNYVDLPQKQF